MVLARCNSDMSSRPALSTYYITQIFPYSRVVLVQSHVVNTCAMPLSFWLFFYGKDLFGRRTAVVEVDTVRVEYSIQFWASGAGYILVNIYWGYNKYNYSN